MNNTALLTTIPSDSHSWNLVYMQMFLEEAGFRVENLGTCVPLELLVERCEELRPRLLIVSTVNGHGGFECLKIAERLSRLACRRQMKLVGGGKLTTERSKLLECVEELYQAGFDGVFYGPEALDTFRRFLAEVGRSSPEVLNLADAQARSPASIASFLEAAGSAALEQERKVLVRRI